MLHKIKSKIHTTYILIELAILLGFSLIITSVFYFILHSVKYEKSSSQIEVLKTLNLFLNIDIILILISIIILISVIHRASKSNLLNDPTPAPVINIENSENISENASIENLMNLYNKLLAYDNQKTEFFSNVSHELKTPLTVILGAIQLAEQTLDPTLVQNKKTHKFYQVVKQNCYRLLRLVNNILDITKIDSGFIKLNLANCNIVYLIEDISNSVIPYLEHKGLNLVFDTDTEEIITAVDIDKIERIFLNLLSNAIKFTEPGGKISIYISQVKSEINISIKDTGCGIPKAMQEKIFERFQQVDSPLTRLKEGSGIGLSLVKSFVDLHGGNITVISKENSGSEFNIQLPIKVLEITEGEVSNKSEKPSRIIENIHIELSDIYTLAS